MSYNYKDTVNLYQKSLELAQLRQPFVVVTLIASRGSFPQMLGAKMLVSKRQDCKIAPAAGTIGGGQLEKRTLEVCWQMLESPPNPSSTSGAVTTIKWNLQTDLQMTCGGEVELLFEMFLPFIWDIAVFGAGHVVQALIPILLSLDCKITCIDHRSEWLQKLPKSDTLNAVVVQQGGKDLAMEVAKLPPDTFFVVMTPGHQFDQEVASAVLKSRRPAYLGVIGSKRKAATIKENLLAEGIDRERMQNFFSPIGLSFGNNTPAEIAISIAAQLIEHRDRYFGFKLSTENI